MLVDPLAPLVKVVCTALLSDALECSDADSIVKGYGDRSCFASFGMRVLENRVVATCPIVLVTEFLQDRNDFLAGEILPNHDSGVEPRRVRFGCGCLITPGVVRQFDRFVEFFEGLCSRRSLARNASFLVDSRPPAIVFLDEPNFTPGAHTAL
jgi:hypothetical protein